jgi:peptide/nickel transport system permease protein
VPYLGRRLGHGLLVLVGVSALCFLLAEAAPGTFLDELRLDPRVSARTLEALSERYGLDRPLHQKYLYWLRSIGRGELGFSVAYDGPVGPLLWPRLQNTLLLTVPATVLAWIIAIPVGVWAASRTGRWADRAVTGATTALISVPDLLTGLLLLFLAVRSGYLPTGGMVSLDYGELGGWQKLRDIASHALLPATALIVVLVPPLVRHVRASVIDTLQARFVQAARAHGVPEHRVLFRHALRAAANPLITLFGLSIAGLLSASLVVESIMSWPGLGPLLLEAVVARDLHLVIGSVVCSTVLLVCGSLIADVLLYLADPRMRADR